MIAICIVLAHLLGVIVGVAAGYVSASDPVFWVAAPISWLLIAVVVVVLKWYVVIRCDHAASKATETLRTEFAERMGSMVYRVNATRRPSDGR